MYEQFDDMFNADARSIESRFKLHIDNQEVTVTSSDTVVDWDTLEQVWSSLRLLDGPFANTLDLTLFNDGRFSPSNESGPYAGKLVPGIKIEGECRAVTSVGITDWLPLGTFYVTDWKAPTGSSTAEIFAEDQMSKILKAKGGGSNVLDNVSYASLLELYIDNLGYSVDVPAGLGTTKIKYGWTSDDSSQLTDILGAALLYANYMRTSTMQVDSILTARAVRAAFTDNTGCLISFSDNNSLIRSYTGVQVMYYTATPSEATRVHSISDLEIKRGTNTLGPYKLTHTPLYMLSSIDVQLEPGGAASAPVAFSVSIESASWTAEEVTLTVKADKDCTAQLTITGKYIELTEQPLDETLEDDDDILIYRNKLVQTKEQAQLIKDTLTEIFEYTAPLATVTTTGNIGIRLFDRIVIDSKIFKAKYDGVVVGIETDGSAGLQQVLTLMDYGLQERLTDIHFDVRQNNLWMSYNTEEG